MRKRRMIIVLTAAMSLTAPTLAQYIPPHSNDPHPPANQPSYQLPSPLSRPGVPGYPGAAHSNDPYYTRTEPVPLRPAPSPPLNTQFPSITPRTFNHPYPSYTPRASRRAAASRKNKDRTISLEQCFRNWDQTTRMSQSSWRTTCRRLAVNGRVGIW